jgi:predicted nucleic acid-binding protein
MERSPKTLVVDASVATKWFVQERDSEKALLLKTGHEAGDLQLTAPDLLVYEVANALNYNPRMTVDELTISSAKLLELDLDLVLPRPEYASEIDRTARKFSISVYDASYVALADIIATKLVTADERLYGKLKGKKSVFLLSALGRDWTHPAG